MSNRWRSSWMFWLCLVFWLWASLKHGQKCFLLPRKYFAMKQNHYFILVESMDTIASVECRNVRGFNCVQWKQFQIKEWLYFWYSAIIGCWNVFFFACLLYYEYYIHNIIWSFGVLHKVGFVIFLSNCFSWIELHFVSSLCQQHHSKKFIWLAMSSSIHGDVT